jgi:hypothetical protein
VDLPSDNQTESASAASHSASNKPPPVNTTIEPIAEAPKRNKAYEGTKDELILGFSIVKDVSEASELLASLKAICALVIRGLETTRVRKVPSGAP